MKTGNALQHDKQTGVGQRIMPCLWFDHEAEEAVNFYVGIFEDSHIKSVARYGEAGAKVSGQPKGSVMTLSFQIKGQDFLALNGGPIFTFSPAISFIVNCETQDEIDELWDKLSDGGTIQQCGWLQDKYGVSWQIVPTVLGELMTDDDSGRSERVMNAMLQMEKLDIEALKQAWGEK